jgi:FeS assembly protein IscX
MKWTDVQAIARALMDRHPEVDPLTVRFMALREWVVELPGFDDEPMASNEAKLEAIQMAWYDEWSD